MTALSTAILAQNPLVYYRCQDNAGSTVADSSSSARTATVHGTINFRQSSLIGADRGGGDFSISPDGTTGYADFSTTGLPSGTSNWTGVIWIKAKSGLTNDPGVALFWGSWGTGAGKAFALGVDPTLHPKFTIFSYDLVGSTPLNNGQIYMLAASWDGSLLRLYQNVGKTVTQIASGNATTPNIVLAAASIGGIGGNTNFFNNNIDEAAIFGSALSLATLQSFYDASVIHLGASVAGSGTMTANAKAIRHLGASAQGSGVMTANAKAQRHLGASAAGSGTMTANAKAVRHLGASVQGAGKLIAPLDFIPAVRGAALSVTESMVTAIAVTETELVS